MGRHRLAESNMNHDTRQASIEGIAPLVFPCVVAVPREQLAAWWQVVRPWVMAAMRRGLDGGPDEQTTVARIMEGRYLLIVAASRAEQSDAAALLELVRVREQSSLHCVAAGGRPGSLEAVGPALLECIMRTARELGAVRVRTIGRKGWGAWLAKMGAPAKAVQVIWDIPLRESGK
jgi:hypothetical protein